MNVRVHSARAEANAAVAAQSGKTYLHQHREGVGPDEFRIASPGNAAARLRRAGVFTERALAVLTDSRSRPCVPVPKGETDALAVPFDDGRGAWSVAATEAEKR